MKSILCFSIMLCYPFILEGCMNGDEDDNDFIRPAGSNVLTRVVTNKSAYPMNEGTVITIINGSPSPISVKICDGDIFYYRDKLVQGKWVTWTSSPCTFETTDFYIVKPQESVSDTIVVRKPGEYRFWYPIQFESGIPLSDTIYSNSFAIY